MNRYYDNCFHTEHNATVAEVKQEGNLFWHRLDETVFYVEGGGMASDVGKINGLDVINLKKVNGEVWHLLEEKLEGQVSLSVNLYERFRKVQIHTTQHLISALLCSIYGCEKISATVGDDFNTIEYSLKSFSDRQCSELQTLCNGLIRDDLSVSIEYPTKVEALKHVSKEKLNHSELRVVRIGNLDYNLCGCIHVPSLRYLQMIMIMGYEKTPRGYKILYACGDQLLQSFHKRYDVLNEASHLLALPHLYVNTGIHRLMNVNKEKDVQLQKWVNRYFESVANHIHEEGNAIYYADEELDVKNFQHLAQYLVNKYHKIVIMILKQEVTCHVILAHDGDTFNACEQFRDLMKNHQLKGGGSKMIAQGGGLYTPELENDLKELKNQLN